MKKNKQKKDKQLYNGVTQDAPYENTADYKMVDYDTKDLFNSQGS